VSTYLVTGGAGFIGSHLVEELLRRGEIVRVVDDLSTGVRENVPAGVELTIADLADPGVAERAVDGCDFVLHQAAIPSVPRSVHQPAETHRANVDATLRLLLAARDAGVKRVVFAGSSSVYGDQPTLPKQEDMAPHPLSPYALHKLIGESYMSLFHRLYGLETVTTRYFNVFGPRQRAGSPYSGVISLFIEAIANGRNPTIHGDGGQTRDFTYVTDVVRGVLACCTAPGAAGQVMNLAAGRRVSLLELVDALQRILDKRVTPVFGPTREGDVRDSQADITRARQILEFEAQVPFEEGLRHTVAWYVSSHREAPAAS
jgi:nucleoside-diphosphate-sugar epimerase